MSTTKHCWDEETFYAVAMTRLSGFNTQIALQLYKLMGSAAKVYENRNHIDEVVPQCSARLKRALQQWDDALKRSEAELELMQQKGIRVLKFNDEDYPRRLVDCDDAPLVLYYKGSQNLNAARMVAVVGTRHCTVYGQDLVRSFIAELQHLCPACVVVSGLAYGVDIHAHRNALANNLPTVGVLAHGLDQLYPHSHIETARKMVEQGGLLTEYMTQTNADKVNFVRRNRIVAGITDATILVESAEKGGGLITARVAADYHRDVFAFPGAVGATYSAGCNMLIRNNEAQLITSAQDMVMAMRWDTEMQLQQAKTMGIERNLFPQLTPQEQQVVDVLAHTDNLSASILAVKANIPIQQITILLFQLEMKGVVKSMAGGSYHLLK
ncbi:MAG: DNA-processing protein DprA [Prevotella sp.]